LGACIPFSKFYALFSFYASILLPSGFLRKDFVYSPIMIKACIFDLDGTLTNTVRTLAYFVNTETAKHGLPPAPVENFKRFAGNGARTLIHRVLAYHGVTDAALEDTILKDYNAAYDADFLYLCTLYDGIAEMINELHNRGIQLAVLSNKPQPTTQKIIRAFFAEGTFSAVFGQREGVPLKPDPAGVFEILALLRRQKQECLYIGDTAVDINTGTSAGLTTVGVLWGFRDRAELEGAGATHIIAKPSELLPLVTA
jgi:HAD hydrolase, family IA, variant 1